MKFKDIQKSATFFDEEDKGYTPGYLYEVSIGQGAFKVSKWSYEFDSDNKHYYSLEKVYTSLNNISDEDSEIELLNINYINGEVKKSGKFFELKTK